MSLFYSHFVHSANLTLYTINNSAHNTIKHTDTYVFIFRPRSGQHVRGIHCTGTLI